MQHFKRLEFQHSVNQLYSVLFLKGLLDSKCNSLNTKFRDRWTGGSLLKQKGCVRRETQGQQKLQEACSHFEFRGVHREQCKIIQLINRLAAWLSIVIRYYQLKMIKHLRCDKITTLQSVITVNNKSFLDMKLVWLYLFGGFYNVTAKDQHFDQKKTDELLKKPHENVE